MAGGQSERFGSPKGLAKIRNKTLIQTVIDVLREQTSGPIAVNADLDSPYASFSETIVPDQCRSLGPLGGLSAALKWGSEMGYSEISTSPLDTPFLPADFLDCLHAAGAPAVAQSNNRVHFLSGLWPTELMASLDAFIQSGERSCKKWIAHCGARECSFENVDVDPFFNVNTQEDLEIAREILRKRTPA